MRVTLICLLLLSLPVASACQSGGTVAVHAGVTGDPYAEPATMDLIPKDAGAHPGKIWVRYADDGLHIWGKVQVNDSDLHWPLEKFEMLSSDHVEIWLSESKTVAMPPIGYGNQFGEIDFKSVADCASEDQDGPGSPRTPAIEQCERWYNEQLPYRKQLERLFTRQWLAAGNGGTGQAKSFFEDFATTAYANLEAAFFDAVLPDSLKPQHDDQVISQFADDHGKHETKHDAAGHPYEVGIATGYTFHFFIPYSAFPPAQQLDLRDLWVMVDVFGHAPDGKKMGALSTTSSQRVWGKPSSFNHLVLDTPRAHNVTPCRAAAIEHNMYGESIPAWYFPLAGKEPLYLSTMYDVENPAGGYMYDPSGVSPILSTNEHFWKTLPGGGFVCGPELAYRKGELLTPTGYHVEKKYFDTRTLADGWMLVRSGPDMSTQSRFGSGQCGSCPVVGFQIYAISPKGEVTLALDIHDEFAGMDGSADGGDLTIAPDWSRVTFYKEFVTYLDDGKGGQKENWTSDSYCLQGHAYKGCGKEDNAKPPKPANFPEVSEDPED